MSSERIPHLMVGRARRIEGLDPGDADYSADTACGLDRNVTLVTSDRAQVRCPACWTAAEDSGAEAEDRTDLATARAVRDAMTQLARLWETDAANLEHAIADGASRHPSEVVTLRQCAYELRLTLRARRPEAQSSGAGPAPDLDPLGDVTAGGPDPTSNSGPFCTTGECTRQPHPEHWQHIAGDGLLVLAMGAAVLGSAE